MIYEVFITKGGGITHSRVTNEEALTRACCCQTDTIALLLGGKLLTELWEL